MKMLSIVFLLATLSVLSAEYTSSTVHLVVTPLRLPQPQPQDSTPPQGPWHLNRVDCVLADLVPKVSQRLKLLKNCEKDFILSGRTRPSLGKKTPYLGWRYTPVLEVWDIGDESRSNGVEHLFRGNGMFTESLYKNLEEISPNTVCSDQGHVAISPLALEVTLACLWLGARHSTSREINTLLDVTSESLPLKYRSIISQLQLEKQTSIRMVTQLYLEESFFPVKTDFSEQLLDIFDIKIEKANFHSGARAELEKINHIVAKNTEGQVIDALTSEVVNEHTQLLLVNTLFFKAKWENQFHISNGFNGDFFLPDGTSVKATYMSREGIYYHYKVDKDGKYKMLELPFQSWNDDPGLYSMIVILPDEVNGLEDVEKHLTADNSWLNDFDLVSTADSDIVKPIIPRFTINSNVNLKNALNKMSAVLLFEDNSDFGNISEKRNIKTSKLYQRIYLDVNEKGANVSPRTKISGLPDTVVEITEHPVEFHAKHSFMFAIVQRFTKSVLLMGRVMKPNFDELFANNSEDLK